MDPIYIALIVLSVLLVLGIMIYLILMYLFFVKILVRPKEKNKKKNEHKEVSEELLRRRKEFESYKKEEVEITSFDGLKLRGYFIPNQIQNKVIILCHGYHSSAFHETTNGYNYYDLGYSLLCIDQRAHGRSEGKYIGMGILERKDVLYWIKFILNKCGEDTSIILEGVSMGASTVMMASELVDSKNVKGIIADCGYTTVRDEFKHLISPHFAKLNMFVFGLYMKIFAKYSMDDASAVKSLSNSFIPLLLIHGGQDDFVPTKFSKRIFGVANSKTKDILIVEGARHAESYRVAPLVYDDKVRHFLNTIKF